MFALQNLARNTPKIVNTAVQQRCMSNIISKPRQRVPFAEKLAHGAIIFTVPLLIPMYCALNFNTWRGKKD